MRDEARARFGVQLIKQQSLLHRLGRLLLLRDSADAAVVRAEALATPEARALAAHWVELAWARARPLLETPVAAASAEAVARGVLAP
jgi:hypothetical protein